MLSFSLDDLFTHCKHVSLNVLFYLWDIFMIPYMCLALRMWFSCKNTKMLKNDKICYKFKFFRKPLLKNQYYHKLWCLLHTGKINHNQMNKTSDVF